MTNTPDPTVCPECGGPTDHDREFPPNPYVCDKCDPDPRTPDPTPVSDRAKRIAKAVWTTYHNNSTEMAHVSSTTGLAELEAEYSDSTKVILRSNDLALHLRTQVADLGSRLAAAENEVAEQIKQNVEASARHANDLKMWRLAERERDEAQGRLKQIRYEVSWVMNFQGLGGAQQRRIETIERLATDDEGSGDG